MKKTIDIMRYENGKLRPYRDIILEEKNLELFLNGERIKLFATIDSDLEELVLGYLWTEGFIEDIGQIEKMELNAERTRIEVSIKNPVRKIGARELRPIPWEEDMILETMNDMLVGSQLFQETANVHVVKIVHKDWTIIKEDLGRFNALDKAIGYAIKNGMDMSKSILFTSGRAPSPLASKAIKAGIPVMASRSAPTDKTLELAAKSKLTVIGFIKHKRMNIYTDYRRG